MKEEDKPVFLFCSLFKNNFSLETIAEEITFFFLVLVVWCWSFSIFTMNVVIICCFISHFFLSFCFLLLFYRASFSITVNFVLFFLFIRCLFVTTLRRALWFLYRRVFFFFFYKILCPPRGSVSTSFKYREGKKNRQIRVERNNATIHCIITITSTTMAWDE